MFGVAGGWLVAKFGFCLGWINYPNDRSSHFVPIPNGGGIGILGAFGILVVVHPIPWTFWMPAIVLGGLSLIGDKIDLSPFLRLYFQIFCSAILLFGLVASGEFFASWLLVPFFCIFLVGTTNFYNFMDGINGIAGITGFLAFSLLATYNYLYGETLFFTPFSLGIAIACLGFLPWNLLSARVFMGDVGSILLGFTFGGLVIWVARNWVDLLCLSAFLFPFYADELITMVERIKRRESLIKSHRAHLYQTLANEKGIDHWRISIGYGVCQLLVGIGVLLLKPSGLISLIIFLTICFIIFVLVSILVKKDELNESGSSD